jgi:MFS family permease
MGIAGSATNLGSVISTLFGSYLCENGFYEGWGSIFILFGNFLFVCLLNESDKEQILIMG